ncbi:hypothetical protein KXD93_24515 [Mucilaginibacter sp. BJC16-A38]|uniref:hypothetical protein n=1 Tax=Mucilaginibacter phenanthrenivorans TaxID=1234842 RepID=UPI0021572CFE|nr:hypothetical protein [Mucilaginibacter phenanthrenivorans]MCR8560844.1 hypothetical protein [Mucilaginibacter phenanthrenivorans]
MKNSAWYHKLWLKKVNQYPVRDDADTSWADMRTSLDEHLPVNISPNKNRGGKSTGGTIVSVLGFVLPAAAMIGLVTFAVVKHPVKNKITPKHQQNPVVESAVKTQATYHDSVNTKTDSIAIKKSFAANNKNVATLILNGTNVSKPVQAAVKAPYINKNMTAGYSLLTPQQSFSRQQAFDPITSTPGTAAIGHLLNISNSIQPLTGANYLVNAGLLKALDASGSSKITVNKAGSSKVTKIKKPKGPSGSSPFEFSAEAALNTSGAGTNVLFGFWAGYPLTSKWQLNSGIRVDINRTLLGNIVHPSYSRPDTVVFNVTDSRRLNVISVPVNLEYKISNTLSILAGPQINFSASQSRHTNKVGNVPRYTDTLSHSQSIDSALRYNSINKVTVGITGGINFRAGHFTIEGLYQQNITPYSVNTGLGNYKQFYHSFQVGIKYTFKKKEH